ncbi:stage II sporulation protein M [Chloroflexota bacterium]
MRSFILAAVLFAVSLTLGMLVVAPDASAETLEKIGEMLGLLASLNSLQLFLMIFLNNTVKALAVIVSGIFLGLPPLIFISFNGFLAGMLISGIQPTVGYGVVIASIAPHGVIEIPLMLLTTALGFAVGRESLRRLTGGKSQVKSQLRRGLRTYFRWILPGLLAAAAIETFITPLIIDLAGG